MLSCQIGSGGFTVHHIQLRFAAVLLGVAVLLPFSGQSAKADTSVPSSRELTGSADERFQAPNPMSREYLQIGRSAARQYEAPAQVQPPVPRRASETN